MSEELLSKEDKDIKSENEFEHSAEKQDLDNVKLDYGEIDDFVNTDIGNEVLEKQNYKDHIKELFDKRPLSIDINQEKHEGESDFEELELDSLSNHALDSKQVDFVEEKKGINFLSKSNFPLKPHLKGDRLEELKDKLPGTVPDLEPDFQKIGNGMPKFDSNLENFLNESEESLLPDNFGEMLDGKNQDMEKVVYFSTLNSQDHNNAEVEQIKTNLEDKPDDEEIHKFE